MTINLPNGKVITLNSQQIIAVELMKEWITNKDRGWETQIYGTPCKLFCKLKGYAGTGKTTITKYIVEDYERTRGWDREIAVTAPTHKAKKVISQATGLEGKTIQSLLGMAPNVDVTHFDINNPEFVVKNKPTIEDYSAIIVDEASMLNTGLFQILTEQAMRYGVKVLFLYDIAQLPPVKDAMVTPVETSPIIHYCAELTQVERQKGDNPLMLVYDKIREDLNSKVDRFPHKTHVLKNGNGIEFIPELRPFGVAVVNAFCSQEFAENPEHAKVLAWTNPRVQYWNKAIRKSIVYRQNPEMEIPVLMPGELLMGYSTYKEGVRNSVEYTVEDNIKEVRKNIFFGDEEEISVELHLLEVALQSIDDPSRVICSVVVPDHENYKRFLAAFDYYHSLGRFKKQWKRYFTWKEQYMLLEDLRSKTDKLIVGKDLDYGYALTVHKSQGSTYDQVFIDEIDINKHWDHVERNKLKYVALSRPRYKATVLTNLLT